MKTIFQLVFIFFFGTVCSQKSLDITVKDKNSKEPLPYCNIVVEGSTKGTMTNINGEARISADPEKDVVVFSYLGYQPQKVRASELVKSGTVYLVPKDMILKEVTVRPDNDYLYDFVVKCRKKLMSNQTVNTSKAYYGLEVHSGAFPIEMLECYYNAAFNGVDLSSLNFRNGRVGHSSVDENYFISLNSSKAIVEMKLTSDNGYFPANPLQLGKNKMKELFEMEVKSFYDSVYVITFTPKNKSGDCFSGDIWLETKSFNLLKINLNIENASIHPFLPFLNSDTLKEISMSISNNYTMHKKTMVPDYINFNYSFVYKSIRDSLTVLKPKISVREISTKVLMYFYEYDSTFILPYFEYDNNFSDYKKISLIPFNEDFWNNNSAVLLNTDQKKMVEYFVKNGKLYNYYDKNYGYDFRVNSNQAHFEYSMSFWSADKRIVLHKENENNKPYTKEEINRHIPSDLYNIKVQILLDVTKVGDSLLCKTYTVFDGFKTYYHFPEDEFTKVFLNLFFDICEIERRKLEKELTGKNLSLKEIESKYKSALENMDKVTSLYLKEVQMGKNPKGLKKWNLYVKEQLSIDNLKMFGVEQ